MAYRRNSVEDRLIAQIDAKRKLPIKTATATLAEVIVAKRERKVRVPLVPYSARITLGQRATFLAQQDQLRKDAQWKALFQGVQNEA